MTLSFLSSCLEVLGLQVLCAVLRVPRTKPRASCTLGKHSTNSISFPRASEVLVSQHLTLELKLVWNDLCSSRLTSNSCQSSFFSLMRAEMIDMSHCVYLDHLFKPLTKKIQRDAEFNLCFSNCISVIYTHSGILSYGNY